MSAKDAYGMTVSDYVDKPPSSKVFLCYRGYHQDLWYCALRREGIHSGPSEESHIDYHDYYTLEHYRAMCYLDTWTKEDLSQQVFESLKAHPETEETIFNLACIREERPIQE